MNTERIDRILQAFDGPTDKYCRAEVDEAVTLREEITPRLLGVLDELVAAPEEHCERDSLLHAYAAALLAHFEEPTAHLPIIRAFSLPEETEDLLWGDLSTELLPTLLFKTCGGKVDALKKSILDRGANESLRASAIDALSLTALTGIVPREEVLAFFAGLFTGAEADRESAFWSQVAATATDLWPEEILPALRQAFDDGLVAPSYVGWDEIEASVAVPREDALARERERLERRLPANAHDYLSGWFCFAPKRAPTVEVEKRIARAERARKKAKKKQAKQSRKKNRR